MRQPGVAVDADHHRPQRSTRRSVVNPEFILTAQPVRVRDDDPNPVFTRHQGNFPVEFETLGIRGRRNLDSASVLVLQALAIDVDRQVLEAGIVFGHARKPDGGLPGLLGINRRRHEQHRWIF